MSARPMRELRIDLSAIRHNAALLADLVAPAALMAVVKAEGYGHGATRSAGAALAGGATWIGVADIDEALALRASGIDAPALAWLHGPDSDFAAAIAADIDLGINSLAQLDAAAAAGAAAVHLKVDTGLNRNGIAAAELPAVLARAAELERVGRIRVRGVWSHLSNTSPEEDAAQLARLDSALAAARSAGLNPELRHLAASAAAIGHPDARLDLVRAGIALYGLAPDPSIDAVALGLRPAMELSATIVNVKRVPAGEGVSYGFTFRTERETTLALVPVGYADGVPRAASGRAQVAIDGVRVAVAGRIAMDQIVVDAGDHPVAVGDRAVLWGDPATGVPSVDEWAAAAGTINYELVARVGGRLERTFVGE